MLTERRKLASYCSSRAWGGLEMNVLRFLGWMRRRGWEVLFYGEPDTHMFRQAEAFDVRAIPVHARYAAVIRYAVGAYRGVCKATGSGG